MRKTALCLGLLLVLACPPAFGSVYYFKANSNGGNGSSWGTAFNSLSSVLSVPLKSGDTVYVNGQFIFYNSLPKAAGVTWLGGNGIDRTYTPHGGKIMSGDTVTTSWNARGGGVYSATIPAGISNPAGVIVDDTLILRSGTTSGVYGSNPAEGGWGASGGTVFVHLQNGIAPTGHQVIVIDENVAFSWNTDWGMGSNITVKGIDFYYWFNFVRLYESADVENLWFEDLDLLGFSTTGLGTNCAAFVFAYSGVLDSSRVPTNVTIRDCKISLATDRNPDHGSGICLYQVRKLRVDSCYFYGTFEASAIQFKGKTANTGYVTEFWIYDNIFDVKNTVSTDLNNAIEVIGDHFGYANIFKNIVRARGSTGINCIGGNNLPFSSDWKVYCNTVVGSGSATGSTNDDGWMPGWRNEFKYNIYYNNGSCTNRKYSDTTGYLNGVTPYGDQYSPGDPHFYIDSNQYYGNNNEWGFRYPTITYNTLSSWYAATGWERHSINGVNPNFADPGRLTFAGYTPSNALQINPIVLTDPWGNEHILTQAGAVQGPLTNTPPTAQFVGVPTSGTAPLTVNFSDQSSGVPSPTSWSWNFGDGGTSTSQNPSHTYNSAGQYTVTLTATNSEGSDQMVRTNYITVAAPQPPTADFSANTTSGFAPLTVQFSDLSTNNPTSWSWNFGDGGTSSSQNPQHTYTSTGQYTVTLTATNANGSDQEIKTNYITITYTPKKFRGIYK